MSTTSIFYTYPHYETRVKDLSIYTPTYRAALPLHQPLFFMRMQQGPIGVPMWYSDYNYCLSLAGQGTMDKYSQYYSREAVFMQTCFDRQGCWGVRLATKDAAFSSVVLSCTVTTQLITQYEKDNFGNFVLDTNGNKIPLLDANNQPVQQPGYSLRWTATPIAQDQNPTTIPVLTVQLADGSQVQTFPIMAFQALYPGLYGDGLAFTMNYDANNLDPTQVARLSSLLYTFAPMAKDYNADTVSPIRTVVGEPSLLVSMKSSALDPNFNQDFAAAAQLQTQYWDPYALMSDLPYSVHIYSNYFQSISNAVLAVEPNLGITDPFMLDIFTGRDQNNLYLDHVQIVNDPTDPTNVVINQNYLIYLQGGSDGAIDDATIEDLTRQYLTENIYPQIVDEARYPFTHLYDTGVTLATKTAMIEFLGVRDDVKVVLSTQDCATSQVMNTMDEDLSVGESLHSSALLQPESMLWGTQCCRAEIYQQVGILNDTTRYAGMLPFTLDICSKRTLFQSKTYMDGMPKGLPDSAVTMFDVASVNWYPYDPTQKQLAWDTGLNWTQYYDSKRIHYADLRTVYAYDTSVLSSAIYTDVIIYAKQIIRQNWAFHAGRELPFAQLAALATKTTLLDMQAMLNGIYGVAIRFYQTEEEANIGYITHCECKLIGNPSDRIWITDILCYRDGYNMGAS